MHVATLPKSLRENCHDRPLEPSMIVAVYFSSKLTNRNGLDKLGMFCSSPPGLGRAPHYSVKPHCDTGAEDLLVQSDHNGSCHIRLRLGPTRLAILLFKPLANRCGQNAQKRIKSGKYLTSDLRHPLADIFART